MLQDTEDKRKERRKQKVCLNTHKHRVLAVRTTFFFLHSTLEECTFDTSVAAIDQGARDEQWGCEYTNTEVSEEEEMK